MKRLGILFFISFLASSSLQSQDSKRYFNTVQTGFLGVWYNIDIKTNEQFSIRPEVGLDANIVSASDKLGLVLRPVLKVEPKWNYNLAERIKNNKNTEYMACNALSIAAFFYPNIGVIDNIDNNYATILALVPSWSLRRNLSKKLNFEFGLGLGYAFSFLNGNSSGDEFIDLKLRIGLNL